jgi:hypothetical protein
MNLYYKSLILLIILNAKTTIAAQERSKELVKSLESTNPEEYKKAREELKQTATVPASAKSTPSAEPKKELASSIAKTTTPSKPIEIKTIAEKTKDTSKTTTTATNVNPIVKTPIASAPALPQKTNNAALKSEIDARNAAIDAANRKNRMKDKDVDYYNALRLKFEAEEKLKAEKEAKEAEEAAKKEAEAYNNRHLKPAEAPQFDKYRNGAKNEEAKKTTAEEDYNKLFK